MRPLVGIVLALALNVPAPQAQETLSVSQRSIDIIAADGRGRHVDTLSPADFAAVQDGVPQPIASAEFVRDSGRVFGIFLDEFHTTPGPAADRVRDALLHFVRTGLGADDRIAVLKPLDSLLTISLIDREVAARVIQSFEGRQGDYTPRSAFERDFVAGAPARIDAARTQIALSALNALTTQLGAAKKGRKTLMVVSAGLPRRPRARGDEPLPTFDTVVRAANRSQVSIYPIEVGGTGNADDAARGGLRALATETAGRVLPVSDDLAAGLGSVLSDASGYYVVTLLPGDQQPDDRFHPVDVRTTRKGVTLRARGGYWAARPPVPATKAGRDPALWAPVATKMSPLIRPWFGMARGSDGATRVSFVWEPATRTPGDRTRLKVPARIALSIARIDTGAIVFEGAVVPSTGAADAAESDARAVFELPPGKLRVRMSIEDAAMQQIDTDVRELVVGNFPGPLAFGTLQVLRVRSAREFRTVAANAEAAPVVARQFSRSERLLIRAPTYASGSEPAVSARLVSRFGVARALAVERWDAHGYQVDLPLAGLAGGDYVVEVTAANEDGNVHDSVSIRVTP